jgi:hypothetical protein
VGAVGVPRPRDRPDWGTRTVVNLRLSGTSTAGGGQVQFRQGSTGTFANSILLNVPTNGTSVSFFATGRFGFPSRSDRDVTIEARRATPSSAPSR